MSRPSLLVQHPTFPGLGLGAEDFPLEPEVRGTRSLMVFFFVGNISGTVPLVSRQCFPLAGVAAAAEVLQWFGFILYIE